MNIKEYEMIKNYTYKDYCDYLKKKYGPVKEEYKCKTKNNRSNEGLFIHHIGENEVASLSNPEVIKNSDPKYQKPEMLVYCNYLEHALLHVMIGQETAGNKNLGLRGNNLFILPALRIFFTEGHRNSRINNAYYEVIKDNYDVYKKIFNLYNETVEHADILIDHNITLYQEVKYCLNTKNKALVVLGTGLGKTTTALQYLLEYSCRALVIVPNNIIKTGWENYDLVDVTTYQTFAKSYKTEYNYMQYGLIILDETHHVGYDEDNDKGAKVWSEGIKYLLDKGYKVLGLTATPERTDNIDIGKTFFKDCICIGKSVEEAIKQKLIHPFSYITAIYNTEGLAKEIKELYADESDTCKRLFGRLDTALNDTPTVINIFDKYKSYMNKKIKGIVFIQDIDKKDEAMDIISKAFPSVPCKLIYSNRSIMSEKEVENNREWFEHCEEGFLFAIDMISEGAHYKGVNTLIMFRKTTSYLKYTQQLGRIITLTKDENPNAIVFDLVNNIENIRYNDRKLKKKKDHSIDKIIEAINHSEAALSGQIIVCDESRDFVKCIENIKSYADSRWQEWEKEFCIKNKDMGYKWCTDRINEEWERRNNYA